MNLQQVLLPRTSSNGYVHRRVDRETGGRTESKIHPGMSAASNSGLMNGGKVGGVESSSRDRLIYVMTYLIGHRVDVHVKNGSVISGIFHAANAEKDFGIVLKMAQVIKDGSVRGHKPLPDTTKNSQTMIIPARELVQVLAKDVSLSSDAFTNVCEMPKDLMIDSAISHSHHVELERELEPWTPDIDDQELPELDNMFDGTWNSRNWDQFETNETLFGVKSTFDEELYTTRLDRGPHMRDIEREASRIAREIEGEETHDIHLAEERGVFLNDGFGLDEESRYSAVHREADDGKFEEIDNSFSDACSIETFGGSISAVSGISLDISIEKVKNEFQLSATCSSVVSEETQASQSKAIDPVMDLKGLSANATSYDPRGQLSKHCSSESAVPATKTATNEPPNLSLRPGSSTSSTCGHVGTASASGGPSLSPSSSVGSLSSEKSTLNPYAKEFKFNPSAKSFAPSVLSRSQAPVSEGSYYYTGNVPQMHNLPVGVGFGASFGGQQPAYNLQGAQMQSPQAYLPPNGPLYGQQMIIGQTRPVFYMPTYQSETPYKGRNF